MTQPETRNASPAKSSITRWLPLIILAGLVVAAYSAGLHNYISLEKIAHNRDWLIAYVEANWIKAILIYMAAYVVVVALSLPGGAILTLVGGFLFGWLVGGTVTVFAATVGAVLVFEIVRTSVGEFLAKRAGPWLSRLAEGFKKDAFHYMLFLRLVPVFPFWLVNIAPALLNVKRSVYIVTTIAGIIPATYAFASLGSGLDSVIVKQREMYEACVAAKGAANCTFSINAKALVTTELLFAFAALSVVALIPLFAKKLKARRSS